MGIEILPAHEKRTADNMALSIPSPGILWHYTTADAFLCILRSKSIWATNVGYLNDLRELTHAIEVAVGTWRQQHDERSLSDQQLETLENACVQALDWGNSSTWVTSFSAVADDLSQWRAYGRPGGVCVGFDVPGLVRAVESSGDPSFPSSLRRCMYLNAEIVHACKGAREEILANAKANGDPDSDSVYTLMALAAECKNGKFAGEGEYRAIIHEPPLEERQFNAVGGVVVPRHPIALALSDPGLVREVITGPSPNPGGAVRGVSEALEHFGVAHAEVRRSEVPYRDW